MISLAHILSEMWSSLGPLAGCCVNPTISHYLLEQVTSFLGARVFSSVMRECYQYFPFVSSED